MQEHIITLYLGASGDKEHLDYPSKESAWAAAKKMKAAGEVFVICRAEVQDDPDWPDLIEVATDRNF